MTVIKPFSLKENTLKLRLPLLTIQTQRMGVAVRKIKNASLILPIYLLGHVVDCNDYSNNQRQHAALPNDLTRGGSVDNLFYAKQGNKSITSSRPFLCQGTENFGA